jgi:membrane protein implicated in regulation of membrane protease activity
LTADPFLSGRPGRAAELMGPLLRYTLLLAPEALVVAGLLWLAVSLAWIEPLTAILVFSLLSLACVLLYPLVRPSLQPGPPVGAQALVGRKGTLLRPATPVGQVRLNGERWRARSKHDEPLAAGTRVRVAEAKGLELIVEGIP